jgi:hypothetical protein
MPKKPLRHASVATPNPITTKTTTRERPDRFLKNFTPILLAIDGSRTDKQA